MDMYLKSCNNLFKGRLFEQKDLTVDISDQSRLSFEQTYAIFTALRKKIKVMKVLIDGGIISEEIKLIKIYMIF